MRFHYTAEDCTVLVYLHGTVTEKKKHTNHCITQTTQCFCTSQQAYSSRSDVFTLLITHSVSGTIDQRSLPLAARILSTDTTAENTYLLMLTQ